MEVLLQGLRGAGEPTRLRLLALCAHGELTVSELTQILSQSQPRVSRHLKLLCEAGLLDRFREGSWAFYRLSEKSGCAHLARLLVDLIPDNDPVLVRDLERLETVKAARVEAAAAYFRDNAARWSEIRSLYVDEQEVEGALLDLFGGREIAEFVDIGTGTGRMLEVFADRIGHGVGVDLSHEMLAFARANLAAAGRSHCQVRHGDMYNLPLDNDSADAVVIHQVLHFADDPAAVIAEATRVLRPGGMLAVVDFAPHDQEFLRIEHAHRRLGFSEAELGELCRAAGLELGEARTLAGDPLTVMLLPAVLPRAA